jgi:hypothetical protein
MCASSLRCCSKHSVACCARVRVACCALLPIADAAVAPHCQVRRRRRPGPGGWHAAGAQGAEAALPSHPAAGRNARALTALFGSGDRRRSAPVDCRLDCAICSAIVIGSRARRTALWGGGCGAQTCVRRAMDAHEVSQLPGVHTVTVQKQTDIIQSTSTRNSFVNARLCVLLVY